MNSQFRHLIRIGAVFMVMAVVACAPTTGPQSVSNSDPSYASLELYRSAARDGEVRLVLAGNLFSDQPEARVAAVDAALQRIQTNVPTAFASNTTQDGWNDPRLVIVFGAEKGVHPMSICNRDQDMESYAAPINGGTMYTLAAFCVHSSARTWTRVSSGVPGSVNDDLFSAIVYRAGHDIIPPLSMRGRQRSCVYLNC